MSDSKLELYETEWKREKARREELERKLEQSESMVVEKQKHISQLEQELQQINQKLKKSEQQAETALEAQKGLKRQLEELRKDQTNLKVRMANERFWRKDFLQPLAEEMAELDEALRNVETPQDWRAQFEIWHEEILNGLERLLNGTDGGTAAEQIRRRVLAQWVFLRWLEIYNLFRERP